MKLLRSVLPLKPKLLKPQNPLLTGKNLEPEHVAADGRFLRKLKQPITLELMDKMEMGVGNSFIYRFALPG